MKSVLVLAVVAIPYLSGSMLPAWTLWFDPGEVFIRDAYQGNAPKVEFTRHIKRESYISYSSVVRSQDGDIACEGNGGPFTYRPTNGALIGKDLVWWSAGDQRCGKLDIGSYWVETCWKVETPLADLLPDVFKPIFGWVLPPKRVCRASYSFNITPNVDL